MADVNQNLHCCINPVWFGSLLNNCDPPDCCCGCCSALRPRYKKLVDNIFPAYPQDGLVRNNMEKLTFYALSSPEKLDRIGEYLALKVSRDISRHRQGFVVIAMEAMDQLLIACHAQSLNLFVESFLKIVQKLLECHEPEMQLLATQSFVKFANIEEDTPSYHRRYDFFVSKFSSLCHNCHDDLETRNRLRVAGLKGIQGVVRKTVSDDLQVNIWDETHMDKIIPSLLFNMKGHCRLTETPDSPQDEASPWVMAENCLRELMGRATFGNVRSVIRPVLKHLDNHELWDPNDFAVHTFKIIIYSIQAQYSYAVIQILMTHLDEKSRFGESDKKRKKLGTDAKVRTGIVNVLANIVSIAAGESIGPSVLEIFNSLLNHLRHSIDIKATNENDVNDEKHFQECVINTLGEFANNLPDFQKIEIMMFIMGKVPLPMDESQEADVLLQKILLKSLLKVGTKYRTVQMAQAFPLAFLQPLMQMSLAPDPAVRIVVHQILHTLLDRHDNLQHLSKPCVAGPLPDLKIDEKCSRQDVMFFKKNGPDILMHMYENVQLINNMAENYEAIYVTLALVCLEFGTDNDALIDLLRLIFAIQELPAKGGLLSSGQNAALHILVGSYLYLLSNFTGIVSFCGHVEKVIRIRIEKAPHLLPDDNVAFGSFGSAYNGAPDDVLFDKQVIAEALRSSGHDVTRLLLPYVPRRVTSGQVTVTRSISDLNSISVEVDSVNSSPGIQRRHPEEEITVESLRKMMAEPPETQKQADDERRLRVIEQFRTVPFEDLVAKAEQQTVDLQNKLNEIFGKVPAAVDISSRPNSPHPNSRDEIHRQTPLVPPVFNGRFPDHFVY